MDQTTRQQTLLARLQQGPVIIADGGMGTQLYHHGAPQNAIFEYLNLTDPNLVSRVHQDYADAGAELLETNTFGANTLRLAAFRLDTKTYQINLAGARLTRTVAGENRWVAGSVGPLIEPKGNSFELTPAHKGQVFSEQMTALAEGGVDCFLLETFLTVKDLELAIGVGHQLGLPVIAQLAFNEGGFSGDGYSVEQAAHRLTTAGATAIGANCGTGPRELAQIVSRMASATHLPVTAFPNSGFPEYVNGRHLYLATPEYFVVLGREMVQAGVNVLGGCCGTTPEHIRAMKQAFTGIKPGRRGPIYSRVEDIIKPTEVETAKPHFLDDWGKRPIVTVELAPPQGLATDLVLAKARALKACGVDAINLAENPLARIRMGNIALAQAIQAATGAEVIVHITGRDRNLLGLHSDLMGAHLLGIRTILAVTGDPVALSGEGGASNVFDVNSIGLLEILNALNNGRTGYGADLAGHTEFLLGAAFNPNVAELSGQLNKLAKKRAAGARFVQTQPVYEPTVLERLAEAVLPLDIPVLVGIMPLVGERNAEFLHNEVPGIHIPESVRLRMCGTSGDIGAETGMEIAKDLVKHAKGLGFGGFYLIPPFGKIELAAAIIEEIRQPISAL